jgi:hypothetical protein
VGEMNRIILLPVLAVFAALIVSAGAFSINGNTGLHAYTYGNTNVNAGTAFGPTYQNISYNNTVSANANQINRTEVLKQIGVVAQCRTNFVDTAAPIASNAMNITLNVTGVNQANARLQSNITANATNPIIRSDIYAFDGSMLQLYGQALRGAQKLNQTQLQSLRAQLNSSVSTLQNCTSGNNAGKRFLGFRFGAFWNGFVSFWHEHIGFHRM